MKGYKWLAPSQNYIYDDHEDVHNQTNIDINLHKYQVDCHKNI